MFKIILNKLWPNYVSPLMAILVTSDSMYLSCAAI